MYLCVMAAPSALFPGVVIILDFVIPSLHGTIYQFFVFPGIRIKGQIFPSSLHLVFEFTTFYPVCSFAAELVIPHLKTYSEQ